MKIFIAQVITSGKLAKYSYIPELNKQIYHLVEQLKIKGLPVKIVNQAKGFNWKIHCLTDKVHPNIKGAEVMADTWFNAIDKELKKFTDTNKYDPELVTYKTTDNANLKLYKFNSLSNKNIRHKKSLSIH